MVALEEKLADHKSNLKWTLTIQASTSELWRYSSRVDQQTDNAIHRAVLPG